MAGSYRHATTNRGNLRSNESFVGMIENLGDAYEMAEEMYGMIWWLAGAPHDTADPKALVQQASENYKRGLAIAREANRR